MEEDDDLAFFMSPMALRKSASLKASTSSTSMAARRSSIPMMHTPTRAMDVDDDDDQVPVVPVPVVRKEQQQLHQAASSAKDPLLPPPPPPRQQGQTEHQMTMLMAPTIATTVDQASPPTRSSGARHHNGVGPSPLLRMSASQVNEEDAGIVQGPPEALYLTGGSLGPAAYNYYAPPLKWRANNTNPRERRVEAGPVHLGPNGTVGGWSASPNPYQQHGIAASQQQQASPSPQPRQHRPAALAVVGNSPVVWSYEASDSVGRRDVFRQRQRDASSAGALDETIQHIASSAPSPAANAVANANSPGSDGGEHGSSASPSGGGRRLDRPLFDDQLAIGGGGAECLLMQEAFPHAVVLHDATGTTRSVPQATAEVAASVRHYYASSSITPFRRVHIHREEEMKPPAASATDKVVDGRRVWGPKEERKYEGVFRSWWQ